MQFLYKLLLTYNLRLPGAHHRGLVAPRKIGACLVGAPKED